MSTTARSRTFMHFRDIVYYTILYDYVHKSLYQWYLWQIKK